MYKPKGQKYPQIYVFSGGNDILIMRRHDVVKATKKNKKEIERYNTIVTRLDMNQEHFRKLLRESREKILSVE